MLETMLAASLGAGEATHLDALQKLMAEFSIAMPMSKKVDDMQKQLGNEIASVKQKALLKAYKDWCAGFQSEADASNMWGWLQNFLNLDILRPNLVDEELKPSLEASLDRLLGFLGGYFSSDRLEDEERPSGLG